MIVEDEAAMLRFGEQLAGALKPGDWLAIEGPLGAGKTVLCRGILRGFGYDGEVASPSYALVHHYEPPSVNTPVMHVDLYRLNSVDELAELGLHDSGSDCITLVEWASRAGAENRHPTHLIDIEPNDDGSRLIHMKILRDE